jgi:hypothetical protein
MEKGREQSWLKKGNLRRTRKNLKNGQNFTPFWVNKMFSSISFNTFKRHFRWLPDGASIFFKEQGAPWEVKGHKGAPWWQKGVAPF